MKPIVWLRYIDDIFFIWNESEAKLDEFSENLNNFHPYLKFTSEKSKKSVNFLDVKVSLIDQNLSTDFFCKPFNCHQFLDFNSAHPIHVKKSIVFSRGLRIKRLCSSNVAFENYLESLKGWFQNRRYSKTLVDNQLKRVLETRQTSEQIYKRGNGVPLVLTYHPRLIISKNILYFYMPRNKSRIYLHLLLLLFHSVQVLVLESIWLGLKYTLFYMNVDHLVVTKVDARLV